MTTFTAHSESGLTSRAFYVARAPRLVIRPSIG